MNSLEKAKEEFVAEFGVSGPAVDNGRAKIYMNQAEMTLYFKAGAMIDALEELGNALTKQRRPKWAAKAKAARTYLLHLVGERFWEIEPAQVMRIAGEWATKKLVMQTRHTKVNVTAEQTDGKEGMIELPVDWYYELAESKVAADCRLCRLRGEQVDICKCRQMFITTDLPMINESPEPGRCPYQD